MGKKNFVIVALCVAVGIMAVAYAAFTTTLTVNGTVNATGTFAVTFNGNGTCTGSKVGADTPTGTATATAGSTTATLSVSLYTPGDTVTCSIPVKNTGNLKAKYVSSTISNGLNSTSTPIAVSVSNYTSKLAANVTGTVDVLVEYNWTGTSQPSTTSASFTITTQYTQDI